MQPVPIYGAFRESVFMPKLRPLCYGLTELVRFISRSAALFVTKSCPELWLRENGWLQPAALPTF